MNATEHLHRWRSAREEWQSHVRECTSIWCNWWGLREIQCRTARRLYSDYYAMLMRTYEEQREPSIPVPLPPLVAIAVVLGLLAAVIVAVIVEVLT